MPFDRARPRTRTLAVLVATALAVTACGDDDEAAEAGSTTSADAASTTTSTTSAPEDAVAAFVGTDFAFEMPEELRAGVVELTLENTGGEDHQLNLFRLGEDQDPASVLASLEVDDLSFTAEGDFVGGPNGVPSGEIGTVVSEVAAGTYVAFCAIPSPSDGVPHYAKGMVTTFEVAGDAPAGAALPDAEGEIAIAADGYGLPDGFDGAGRFTVTNDAPYPTELALFRLQEGRTQDDLVAFLGGSAPPGPPPFVPGVGGGVSALGPGDSSVVELDLPPGSYVFLSFLPDPGSGFAPQFTAGLINTVEVSA